MLNTLRLLSVGGWRGLEMEYGEIETFCEDLTETFQGGI